MFPFEGEEDLGRAPPPTYAFTCDTPLREPKPKAKCGPARGFLGGDVESHNAAGEWEFPAQEAIV